ncbi:MAG: ABC transporter ATP-binding protein [Gemmatimonadetes bacterium]|nr:ABC transporter ATP-binding protein [Gemmatimonadota bacterium]NNM05583.1 ABC transporter ATP-binding protein [Gemmatimonadota bacterium]
MLDLEAVTKRYGDFTAVRELDLEVPRGKIFGFLGPNGAGKTTTIRMVSGVLLPSSGRIWVGGDDLAEYPERAKSRIGYIPDRPYLYEKLTGAEFLRFVAGLWGKDGAESEARAQRLMELFNLDQWSNELVESYSHGMRQKLLISSALIHQPELIVVDEPMVGLDPKAARILKDLFRTYVRNGGSVFLSSHTLEVVEVLCDLLAIIHEGRVIARGTMEELREQAEAGQVGLEEIFLKVTGGDEVAEVVANLQDGEY